jgi:hypothetical protein
VTELKPLPVIIGEDGRRYTTRAAFEEQLRDLQDMLSIGLREAVEKIDMSAEDRDRADLEIDKIEVQLSRLVTSKLGALDEGGGTA